MIPSRHPSLEALRRRRFFWGLTLLALAVLILFWALRRPPASLQQPLEMAQSKMEQRAGLWFVPGQSNAFTGLLIDSYDDGSRRSCSTVSNGRLEGLSSGFYTNGQQQVEEYFSNGTSHGTRLKWHPNGRKLSEVKIVHGKLEGVFRRWDEQGALVEEMEMSEGEPDGLSRSYYPSGFVRVEAHLRSGKLLDRQEWKDREHAATHNAPDSPETSRPTP